MQCSGKRKLQFNDTVEVYYYPENKEQHNHHNESDLEDEDEESIYCNEPNFKDDLVA